MGSFGWFILGYMVTGIIVNYVSTWTMIGIAVLKTWLDRRKKIKAGEITKNAPTDMKYAEAMSDTFEDAADDAEAMFDPGNRKRAIIKAWIIGTLILWPITVFHGIQVIWNAMKNAEDR